MQRSNGKWRRVAPGLLIVVWACAQGGSAVASRPAAPARLLRLPAAQDDSTQIDRLIKQLGSEQFAEREAASRELAAYGESALPALRRAAAGSGDAEVRRRARELVRTIVARLLNPPKRPGQKDAPLWWDGR